MYQKFLVLILGITLLSACSPEPEGGHSHEEEEHKFQYTAYSDDYELFAEADPFVQGESSVILSHFSILSSFKALESGEITLSLYVNGKEVYQKLEKPSRKGIYEFELRPENPGNGFLKYEIKQDQAVSEIIIQGITVFANEEEADKSAEENEFSTVNTSFFSKEQSWKIDFETSLPFSRDLGEVISTTALITVPNTHEIILSARTSGIVHFSEQDIIEGTEVGRGKSLVKILGSGMDGQNILIRYAEAKNTYEKAESEYQRAKLLAEEQVLSQKELAVYKYNYDVAALAFQNMDTHFSSGGQDLTSPFAGFIKKIYVSEGAFAETGQALLSVARKDILQLEAEVEQSYAPLLGNISSANISLLNGEKVYSLEELNGKLIAYGKSADADNLMIPVVFRIDNKAGFFPGSLVEINMISSTGKENLCVPNTALIEEMGNFFLYVQHTPELFEKRIVKTGNSDGKFTEIINGIDPSERIVTRGAVMIKLAQATGNLDAHSGHVH